MPHEHRLYGEGASGLSLAALPGFALIDLEVHRAPKDPRDPGAGATPRVPVPVGVVAEAPDEKRLVGKRVMFRWDRAVRTILTHGQRTRRVALVPVADIGATVDELASEEPAAPAEEPAKDEPPKGRGKGKAAPKGRGKAKAPADETPAEKQRREAEEEAERLKLKRQKEEAEKAGEDGGEGA